MNIYGDFASIYDNFIEAPYEQWAQYIEEIWRKHGVAPKMVLDLACGTGSLTHIMAAKGYDMIGVDMSPDMLSEAQNKNNKINKINKNDILFLMQDMRQLELFGTVDAAYCACDGLNYMLTDSDFMAVLEKVALYLNPNGIFIFDLNTEYKYTKLGSNTYIYNVGSTSYEWKNCYNKETGVNEYQVKFFFREKDKKSSFIELHKQRVYSPESVKYMARQVGLTITSVNDAYTSNPPRDTSSRLSFLAKKQC